MQVWRADIGALRPSVAFKDMEHANGMSSLLQKIVSSTALGTKTFTDTAQRTFGFCLVEGTPATPEATEALLESIGPIRNTHYGWS